MRARSAAAAAREELRIVIRAHCAEKGWTAAELARRSGLTASTARGVLDAAPSHLSTMARVARRLGLDVYAAQELPGDEPRDTSRIGRQCSCSEVDLPALRYVLRQLVDEARLSREGRSLLMEAGRLAGLPGGWADVPLLAFEA